MDFLLLIVSLLLASFSTGHCQTYEDIASLFGYKSTLALNNQSHFKCCCRGGIRCVMKPLPEDHRRSWFGMKKTGCGYMAGIGWRSYLKVGHKCLVSMQIAAELRAGVEKAATFGMYICAIGNGKHMKVENCSAQSVDVCHFDDIANVQYISGGVIPTDPLADPKAADDIANVQYTSDGVIPPESLAEPKTEDILTPIGIPTPTLPSLTCFVLIVVVQVEFLSKAPWGHRNVFLKLIGPLLMPIRFVGLFGLMLIRLVFCIFAVVFCGFISWRGTRGSPPRKEKDGTSWNADPLSNEHIKWLRPLPFCIRAILFLFVFFRIHVKGDFAEMSQCKIIVAAPHASYLDYFILWWVWYKKQGDRILPAVGTATITKWPVVGDWNPFAMVGYATRSILVNRTKDGKRACREAIEECSDWSGPPLLIFPEGHVTEGKVITTFSTGAFGPLKPVLPVTIKYGDVHGDVHRLFTRFVNECEVTFLHELKPKSDESPQDYCTRVHESMARSFDFETIGQ